MHQGWPLTMGKHSKIDPLPEPIKPGVHDLDTKPLSPVAEGWARMTAQERRRKASAPVPTLLHIDHRGDGSTQPVAPTPPDRIAEGWALVSHRDRKRFAMKYPELITAIVRHIEGTD